MYAIASRYSANSPWVLKSTMYTDPQVARQDIRTWRKYDLTRSEYRIIPLGGEDCKDWINPDKE